MAAAVVLDTDSLDTVAAKKYLDVAQSLADSTAPTSALAEFHYRALQLATHQSNESARRQHADWIVRQAVGSVYELPALIISVKAVESEFTGRTPTSEQLQEVHDLYSRLCKRLGDSTEQIKSQKNSQVAASKLAHYATLRGDHSTASETLARLAAAFPTDQGYLRRAGLADFNAANYARSIERWRILTTGLSKGTDEWFEAKYYQIACLAKIDATQAKPVMQQFQLLFPDLGSAAWQDKFRALQQQLR